MRNFKSSHNFKSTSFFCSFSNKTHKSEDIKQASVVTRHLLEQYLRNSRYMMLNVFDLCFNVSTNSFFVSSAIPLVPTLHIFPDGPHIRRIITASEQGLQVTTSCSNVHTHAYHPKTHALQVGTKTMADPGSACRHFNIPQVSR